jgi:hypothetical protein
MGKKVASAKGAVASEESEVVVKSPSVSLRTRSKKGAAGDAALNTLNVDIDFTCSIESCSNPYLEPCTLGDKHPNCLKLKDKNGDPFTFCKDHGGENHLDWTQDQVNNVHDCHKAPGKAQGSQAPVQLISVQGGDAITVDGTNEAERAKEAERVVADGLMTINGSHNISGSSSSSSTHEVDGDADDQSGRGGGSDRSKRKRTIDGDHSSGRKRMKLTEHSTVKAFLQSLGYDSDDGIMKKFQECFESTPDTLRVLTEEDYSNLGITIIEKIKIKTGLAQLDPALMTAVSDVSSYKQSDLDRIYNLPASKLVSMVEDYNAKYKESCFPDRKTFDWIGFLKSTLPRNCTYPHHMIKQMAERIRKKIETFNRNKKKKQSEGL